MVEDKRIIQFQQEWQTRFTPDLDKLLQDGPIDNAARDIFNPEFLKQPGR